MLKQLAIMIAVNASFIALCLELCSQSLYLYTCALTTNLLHILFSALLFLACTGGQRMIVPSDCSLVPGEHMANKGVACFFFKFFFLLVILYNITCNRHTMASR